MLRDRGIDTVASAGMAMWIEPTVRHAVDFGYLPIVVADAGGAGNAEDVDDLRAQASGEFDFGV